MAFFHPMELAVSTGIALPLTLSAELGQSTTAVGNMISESHAITALATLLHMSNSYLEIHDLPKIEEFLVLHQQQCMSNDNMEWIFSSGSHCVTVRHKSLQEIPITIADPETQPRRIQVIPVCDGDTEPNVTIKIDGNSTTNDLMTAEAKLQGTKRKYIGVYGDDTEKMELHDKLDDDEVLLLYEEHAMHEIKGITCHWTDGSCFFDLPQHRPFDCIRIEGRPITSAHWTDVDGKAIDLTRSIGFHKHVYTKETFGWNQIKINNELKVIIVEDSQTSSFMIQHSDEETVESLLLAQQILLGPQIKTIGIADAMARTIETSKMLRELAVAVLHVQSSHDKLRVYIAQGSKTTEHWITKGTRLFELCPPQAGKVIVDHAGCELPWDLPCYQNISASIINPDDEMQDEAEIPPTEPFVIDEPSEENPAINAGDLSISALVQQNMRQIQSRLQQMIQADTVLVLEWRCSFTIGSSHYVSEDLQ